MNQIPETIGKILVHRLGSLGDIIVALPCFHLIRRRFPAAKVILLTNTPISCKAAPAMEVLDGSGLVDGSIAYPVALRDPFALLALRREIKSHGFDLGVELNSDRTWWQEKRDHFFLRSCGVKNLVGTQFCATTQDHRPGTPQVMEQECSRLARRIQPIGSVHVEDRDAWDMRLRESEHATAVALLQEQKIPRSFLAASVGTAVPVKDWGVENWTRLASLISKAHPHLGLVLIGAGEEQALSESVRRAWAGPSLNLCGRTSPRVAAAVIQQAALFVGHDSGPMHLAAAVGTPLIALFSWHNPPGQWHPGCIGWKIIQVFYPPTPNGVWAKGLQMRRSPTEGILLIRPEQVADACAVFMCCAAN